MRKVIYHLLLAVVMLILVAPVNLSQAQVTAWASPIRLSEAGQSAWFPDVTIDNTGTIHVVWSAASAGYDVVAYTNSSNGQNWAKPTDIIALPQVGGTYATRPSIVASADGYLSVTARDARIFFFRSRLELSTRPYSWSSGKLISEQGYYSQLKAKPDANLHLIYTQNIDDEPGCIGCTDVFYRSSSDGTDRWSSAVNISNSPAVEDRKSQFVIDGQGNLHAVWVEVGQRKSIHYAASYDGGTTWEDPVSLSADLPASDGDSVAIALDGQQELIVVWLNREDDRVYYRISRDQGRTWSYPQHLSTVWGGSKVYEARFDGYSMATDTAGNVHLVMVGRLAPDQQQLSVLHVTWNGTSWSESIPMVTLSGDVPEWPRIFVGLGNQLHVVWFTRDQRHIFESEGDTDYRVWYSRAFVSAPAVAPVVYPTSTPLPLPTSTPSLERASPTPPAVNPVADQFTRQSLTTELDDYGMIALSVAPIVFLFLLAVLLIRHRQG